MAATTFDSSEQKVRLTLDKGGRNLSRAATVLTGSGT